MLDHIPLSDILFLDIETVPQEKGWEDLPKAGQELWERKSLYWREKNNADLEESYGRAGIYAEFGKIICISVGFLFLKDGEMHFRTKSYAGDDEEKLLSDFADLLNSKYGGQHKLLCAHNGKEFDFPYLSRRMLIKGIALPYLLDNAGKKPWEVGLLDTMHLWSFGDYKNFSSLNLLAHIFDIPTPKDDIDGSQVAQVYYEEKDLERIVQYCQKDTLTVAQLFLRYRRLPLVAADNVEHL